MKTVIKNSVSKWLVSVFLIVGIISGWVFAVNSLTVSTWDQLTAEKWNQMADKLDEVYNAVWLLQCWEDEHKEWIACVWMMKDCTIWWEAGKQYWDWVWGNCKVNDLFVWWIIWDFTWGVKDNLSVSNITSNWFDFTNNGGAWSLTNWVISEVISWDFNISFDIESRNWLRAGFLWIWFINDNWEFINMADIAAFSTYAAYQTAYPRVHQPYAYWSSLGLSPSINFLIKRIWNDITTTLWWMDETYTYWGNIKINISYKKDVTNFTQTITNFVSN
jgi:hypothetical protein